MEPWRLCWLLACCCCSWWSALPVVECRARSHSGPGLLLPSNRTSLRDRLGRNRSMSPDDLGLKGSPPQGELVFPEEPPDPRYDPPPQDLNITMLLARLGRHYDPAYMSIEPRPTGHRGKHHGGGASVDFPFRQNKRGRLVPTGEMPESLQKLKMRPFRLPNGTRVRPSYPAKFRKKLQHFLWAFTACPLEHHWRDLGVRFWPRYLRLGHCPAGSTSCSIPPGMHCRAGTKVEKKLLSWRCFGHHSDTLQCHWMDFNMPIIDSCTCSCPKNGSAHD